MEMGSHDFVVEKYSLRRKGIGVNNAIESEEFNVGGYRWTIRLYPDGADLDGYDAKDASLYISLKSETIASVRCLYELYVLDQSGKGNHWCRPLFRSPKEVPCLLRGVMCGFPHFIREATLESSDYLKDDCLRIRATIAVFTTSHIQNLQDEFAIQEIQSTVFKELESSRNRKIKVLTVRESFAEKMSLTISFFSKMWPNGDTTTVTQHKIKDA